MISLFICLTLDGYLSIMYPAMSTTEKGLQPIPNNNPAAFFYFFTYIVVCVFAMMQMFIGIVFYQYTKMRKQREGSWQLDIQQRQWLEISALVRCPHSLFSAGLYRNSTRILQPCPTHRCAVVG